MQKMKVYYSLSAVLNNEDEEKKTHTIVLVCVINQHVMHNLTTSVLRANTFVRYPKASEV